MLQIGSLLQAYQRGNCHKFYRLSFYFISQHFFSVFSIWMYLEVVGWLRGNDTEMDGRTDPATLMAGYVNSHRNFSVAIFSCAYWKFLAGGIETALLLGGSPFSGETARVLLGNLLEP